MVTAYGDPLWGAFLAAWIFKLLITRLGGIGLYRKLIPGFLDGVLPELVGQLDGILPKWATKFLKSNPDIVNTVVEYAKSNPDKARELIGKFVKVGPKAKASDDATLLGL